MLNFLKKQQIITYLFISIQKQSIHNNKKSSAKEKTQVKTEFQNLY